MELSELEQTICAQARRYCNGQNMEDLEQIGRIAAWQQLKKNPDSPVSHIYNKTKYAMLNSLRHDNTQKRKPRRGIISLDAPVYDDKSMTEYVGEEDQTFNRFSLTIIDLVKKKFGKRYCEAIKQENQPKKIVKRLIRTAIEDIGGFEKEEIPQKADYNFFINVELDWLLWIFYNNSPAAAIMDAYKGEYLPWNFNRVPKGFWKGKIGERHSQYALQWFREKKDIYSPADCSDITVKDFSNDGLFGLLYERFNTSPFRALKSIFPDLSRSRKKYVRNRFTTLVDERDILLDYLEEEHIGDISQLTLEETYDTPLKEKVTTTKLRKLFCGGIMNNYHGSGYLIFKKHFPDQIEPWSLKGRHYGWKDNPREVAARAIRWLFEQYIKIPLEDIPSYATQKFLKSMKFGGLLTRQSLKFNGSPYLVVNNAYPGVFTRKDFDRHRAIKVYDS